MDKNTRTLSEIAAEIESDWSARGKGVSPHARPYLDALYALKTVGDRYGEDSAPSVVRHFLANAAGWTGETARRVKAELRELVQGRY